MGKQMFGNIIVEGRKKVLLSGVTDVDRFEEDIIHAYTILGELTIKGFNLHVNALSVETGDMDISGDINSLVYGEERTSPLTFIQKIFR
ncbi:MAG: YabP/YqfC family sporulation protein [Ruminococcus sp.]|jgi:sporulation protein YabP|nr:YabP/YqfC family sporulation protein [Ruminococcus sp.]